MLGGDSRDVRGRAALEAPAHHRRGGIDLPAPQGAPARHKGAGLRPERIAVAYKPMNASKHRWRTTIAGEPFTGLVRASTTVHRRQARREAGMKSLRPRRSGLRVIVPRISPTTLDHISRRSQGADMRTSPHTTSAGCVGVHARVLMSER